MTAHPLASLDVSTIHNDNPPFSSAHWLSYFQDNKSSRTVITLPQELAVPQSTRLPLIRSLQRFQIGETGEGKHLRKYASRLNDAQYEECIDLFIKEEQFHARVLAQIIAALDGTLLSWHWTDLAFIVLRRTLGIKTEILILLIAEIIGKCFYRVCADGLKDRMLSDAFSLIVLDEIGHLEFHCNFLGSRLAPLPRPLRRCVFWVWRLIFYVACFVFIADHRATLKALNVTPGKFMADCATTYRRAAVRALSLAESS